MKGLIKGILITFLLLPAFLQHPAFMYSSLVTSKVVGPGGVNLSNSYKLVPTAVFYIYRKRSNTLERIPDFLKTREIDPYQLELKPHNRGVE